MAIHEARQFGDNIIEKAGVRIEKSQVATRGNSGHLNCSPLLIRGSRI